MIQQGRAFIMIYLHVLFQTRNWRISVPTYFTGEKHFSCMNLPVLYRLYLSGNIFLQSLHPFSLLSSNTAEWPSCISRKVFLWCVPRGPFSFASFLHRRQRCLIPEWSEFLCLFKVPFLWNAFPQSAHWYDLYAFSHEALCHNLLKIYCHRTHKQSLHFFHEHTLRLVGNFLLQISPQTFFHIHVQIQCAALNRDSLI